MLLSQHLEKREEDGNPIRVGVIGVGKFGAALVAQISQMKGMNVSAIADINPDHAKRAYDTYGIDGSGVAIAETVNGVDDAVSKGTPIVTNDGLNIANSEQLDVVVDATGIPDVGAQIAYHTLTTGKHLVMVNVEADVTIGPMLRRLADSAGVVCTAVDGDQPGATMNIVDWARTLGLDVVAAGRGTVFFDDDRAGIPDTVPERFGFSEETLENRTINLKMFNTFRDGTKAQTEMTALANMAGLPPDVRGMHEPSVNLADIPRLFSLQEEGGLLSRHGVVELANSVASDGRTMLPDPLKMGVFAVVRSEHPFTQEDLAFYGLHKGGHKNGDYYNYLLYRPYHLVAVTAPMSIAKAVIYGQPTGACLPTPVAELITVAKSNIEEGQTLDGGGGYTVNGLCEKAEVARAENLLPLGLAYGAVLKQDVAQGEAITYDMVDLREDSFVLKMRRLQDATVW
ncbi:MAG: NAD(P)-dependent oxidoreductase [Chloroflexota bacterium]